MNISITVTEECSFNNVCSTHTHNGNTISLEVSVVCTQTGQLANLSYLHDKDECYSMHVLTNMSFFLFKSHPD